MPCSRSLVTGIDHSDATLVIDVRKLIHLQQIHVLEISLVKQTGALGTDAFSFATKSAGMVTATRPRQNQNRER
jgi:hypothetical protein